MELVDSHCHLWARGLVEDLPGVLERSRKNQITGWWVCGTEPGDWDQVLALTQEPGVVGFIGVHPWYIPEGPREAWLELLDNMLKAHPGLMLGEAGLDRTAGPALETQEAVFIPQIQLAKHHRRCLNLHGRRTWDRIQLLLRRHGDPGLPSVLHSFSGTPEDARGLLDRGCYFSFSASLTRDRNQRLPQTLKSLPLDRILIETDSPDILPQDLWRENPHRPNESSFMLRTLDRMAQVLSLDPEVLGAQLQANARQVLKTCLL